jgi:hypothetical protein
MKQSQCHHNDTCPWLSIMQFFVPEIKSVDIKTCECLCKHNNIFKRKIPTKYTEGNIYNFMIIENDKTMKHINNFMSDTKKNKGLIVDVFKLLRDNKCPENFAKIEEIIKLVINNLYEMHTKSNDFKRTCIKTLRETQSKIKSDDPLKVIQHPIKKEKYEHKRLPIRREREYEWHDEREIGSNLSHDENDDIKLCNFALVNLSQQDIITSCCHNHCLWHDIWVRVQIMTGGIKTNYVPLKFCNHFRENSILLNGY